MKVVLVSVPNNFTKEQPSPSLALGILSSCLKSKNIEYACIDCNFFESFKAYKLDKSIYKEREVLKECISLITQQNPDIVSISSWGVSLPFAILLVEELKTILPDVPVIIGGIKDQFLAVKILEYSDSIDAVIIGDGDAIFTEVIEGLNAKKSLKEVRGIVYRENSKVISEKKVHPAPVSAWKRADYSGFVHPIANTFLAEGSRGCSHDCIFCTLNNESLRRKTPDGLVNDFIELKDKYGAERITLTDNFIPLSGEWIDRFCDILIEKQVNVSWSCCTRVDHVHVSTVNKMARAGCRGTFIGVESISQYTLSFINKSSAIHNYLSNVLKNIHIIKDFGLSAKVSTIIGFPYEGVGDMQRTVEFVSYLRQVGVEAYTGPAIVYPGSRFWDFCQKQNISLQKVSNQRIRRNEAGPFSHIFEDIPYLVPNNFLPKHQFLEQEELEALIAHSLDIVTNERSLYAGKKY